MAQDEMITRTHLRNQFLRYPKQPSVTNQSNQEKASAKSYFSLRKKQSFLIDSVNVDRG